MTTLAPSFFEWTSSILAGKKDNRKSLGAFEFWLYLTAEYGVSCYLRLKINVSTFSWFLLISFSTLQVIRNCIMSWMSSSFNCMRKSWMSSNFSQIGLQTTVLAALECLKHTLYIMGEIMSPLFLGCFFT